MKLSSAQAALLHTAESAASSALMTLVIGIWQQIATGQVSWPTLFTVFGSGFVAALGLIYKSVTSSPNLQQAETDTMSEAVAEAKSLAQAALAHIENIWPVLHQLNTQQAATKAVPPASVPQVPFPVTNNTPPTSPMLNTFPMMPAVPKP